MPKVKRIHRQRKQTPEQQAEEKAIREKLQKEKPSLQGLIDSGAGNRQLLDKDEATAYANGTGGE